MYVVSKNGLPMANSLIHRQLILINELLARFWIYAEQYYRDASGNQTSELGCIRISLRPFCALYGHIKAVEFGPRCLRAVQQKMVQIGWCRNNINRSLSRVKMLFKWGVSQELVPSSVYHAISTVPGLRKGRSDAREYVPVKPVPQEYINVYVVSKNGTKEVHF